MIRVRGQKYEVFEDGEGTALNNGHPFNFKCCDCGLVHRMVIYTERLRMRTMIGLALERDKRKTAAARREMKKRGEGIL